MKKISETLEIQINTEKRFIEDGIIESSRFRLTNTNTFIEKVEHYALLLGLDSSNMYPIFISLLVEGKIKVQFKNSIEKMMLNKHQEKIKAYHIYIIKQMELFIINKKKLIYAD